VPELTKLRGRVLSEILLETLEYTATSTLNVILPAVDVYVAPANVSSAVGNPAARKIATIPMIASGAPGLRDHRDLQRRAAGVLGLRQGLPDPLQHHRHHHRAGALGLAASLGRE
jgi:anaerobic glycerol-3-phosphate dehydrogenase